MKNKTPNRAVDALKALHNFMCEPDEDIMNAPYEHIQAFLKEHKIDTVPMVNHVRQRIAKIMAEEELSKARARRLKLIDKGIKIGKELPEKLKGKIQEILENLKASHSPMAEVYYRKFEEASEEDYETLWEDLKLLEQINKEDSGK